MRRQIRNCSRQARAVPVTTAIQPGLVHRCQAVRSVVEVGLAPPVAVRLRRCVRRCPGRAVALIAVIAAVVTGFVATRAVASRQQLAATGRCGCSLIRLALLQRQERQRRQQLPTKVLFVGFQKAGLRRGVKPTQEWILNSTRRELEPEA